MANGPRVFFWVQHLLGIGHLRRAVEIARTMAEDDLDVLLISGGLPMRDINLGDARFAQLPPVKSADSQFSALVGSNGESLDDDFLSSRCDHLMNLLETEQPDAIITEMFPFGRRQLHFELVPLLERAWKTPLRPRVFCSVRDVLTEKSKPQRHREMAESVSRWFDHILVHGDETLIPFSASFSETSVIANRICYTGYVATHRPNSSSRAIKPREVLVSAGGGAVGDEFLQLALAARSRSRFSDSPWRLLVGDNLNSEAYERLRKSASPGVTVERARRDFPELLRLAAVSVSQAGYNTVTDVLGAGTPAVLVPFAESGQTEQLVRSRYLEERGLAHVIYPDELDPKRLATAIDSAAQAPRSREHRVRLDGAATTARLVRERLLV